ncbi:MAG: alpha/beta hydrolase [Ornithinibacter sp.]
MTRRHSSVTQAEHDDDDDGHAMGRQHHGRDADAHDTAAALLAPEGGAGAELRGHVPAHPDGVVLVLHGGAAASRAPITWRCLAVLRMVPFATAIHRRAGDRLAVVRLKNRVRGWNGTRQDPLQDARWALDRIRHVLPRRPVVLVGHSMGGRVALQLSGEPDVVGVAALAPWVEFDTRQPPPGVSVLLAHGSNDRVTDPRRTDVLAKRYTRDGVDLRYVEVEGGIHSMLRYPRIWHEAVADFVTDVLSGPARTS